MKKKVKVLVAVVSLCLVLSACQSAEAGCRRSCRQGSTAAQRGPIRNILRATLTVATLGLVPFNT